MNNELINAVAAIDGITRLPFFGCYVENLLHFEDTRGSLTPFFQDGEGELVMAYTSTTYAGEARDKDQWHVHTHQTDRFVCIYGSVIFALSDGVSVYKVTLEPSNPKMLYIPPGVYHCFSCVNSIGESIIINFPTKLFDPNDEGRVKFTDLEAPHPW